MRLNRINRKFWVITDEKVTSGFQLSSTNQSLHLVINDTSVGNDIWNKRLFKNYVSQSTIMRVILDATEKKASSEISSSFENVFQVPLV